MVMRRGSPQPLQEPLAKRLRPLAFALVVMVAFILFLTWVALQTQVALAGFLNGESVWSKAQKQAVVDLLNYAATGNDVAYEGFEQDLITLDAFKSARDEVLSGDFDLASVEAKLQEGHAMPVAIPPVIFMLAHFSDAPYMKDALTAWRAADEPIVRLKRIASRLHEGFSRGTVTVSDAARARSNIAAINAFIAPHSDRFSLAVAKGAVAGARVLFAGVTLFASGAIVLWLLMARRVLAGIRGSEERYRLLFDNAPDAILMVDEASGKVLDANRTAGAWTGCDPRALHGVPYADLFDKSLVRNGASGSGQLRGVDDRGRPVETQSSIVVWGDRAVRQAIVRDISERVERDRARRISAEALASIAEGVIIADAERRAVTVNAAARKITGYSGAELAQLRLDDTRSMADGSPLPASIWNEVAAHDHWSGEIQSRRADGTAYPERLAISTIRDANRTVLHYVAVFSDVSVAKADRRRLEYLAEHDPLTGLVNRSHFQRHCEEAIARSARERTATVVLFIDLDAFKFVNDSYSHAVGDRLLELVGRRIVAQLREGDVAGRIGGDEFTVLLTNLTLREDAAPVAGRMLSALSEPFRVDDCEIVVSASIGIAAYPLDGEDAKTLIARADAAMYAAKSEERDTWRFYGPTMQADAGRRMALAAEMRQALQEDQFRLVYQPSVELDTGRVVGVEALIRWHHPERGEVFPDEFIPVAESTGLIQRIDEWVMQTACAQVRAWDAQELPGIRVAVNVSARWFAHPGFVESVRRALQVHEVPPERIVLEITESAILRLSEKTEATMRALHVLGVGVAIDDFGTGYASMAYLKLPAVTYLKIDRSFVVGLPGSADDAAIARAIIAMTGSLGLTAIAEGIETEAQHAFLAQAGCAEGQGYLYAYPMPAAAFERMLKPRQRSAGMKLSVVPPCRS